MGAAFSEEIAGEAWNENRVGMNVLGYGRPWEAGGPMILHSEWWLRAHWGRAFDVLAFQAEGICGQDALLLRRRDVADLTPETIDVPEAGDERELTAARHAIRQLYREHALLNAAHDAYAKAYREESERLAQVEARVRELEAARAAAEEALAGPGAALSAVVSERTTLGRLADRVTLAAGTLTRRRKT